MPEQVLKIEPEHELTFKGPFTTPTPSMLKLSNPSDKRVCFKIKTTAPKRYCVRPNSGLLEPHASLSIAVVFQPCELEPAANKHKFMVQAIYAPDHDVNMDQLWKEVDISKVMDTKLRCTFIMPEENDDNSTVPEEEKKRPSGGQDEVAPPKKQQQQESRAGDNGSRPQEGNQLQRENQLLKDECNRLRRAMNQRSNAPANLNTSPPALPMLYIVLSIAAVLVGLVLGKFIL